MANYELTAEQFWQKIQEQFYHNQSSINEKNEQKYKLQVQAEKLVKEFNKQYKATWTTYAILLTAYVLAAGSAVSFVAGAIKAAKEENVDGLDYIYKLPQGFITTLFIISSTVFSNFPLNADSFIKVIGDVLKIIKQITENAKNKVKLEITPARICKALLNLILFGTSIYSAISFLQFDIGVRGFDDPFVLASSLIMIGVLHVRGTFGVVYKWMIPGIQSLLHRPLGHAEEALNTLSRMREHNFKYGKFCYKKISTYYNYSSFSKLGEHAKKIDDHLDELKQKKEKIRKLDLEIRKLELYLLAISVNEEQRDIQFDDDNLDQIEKDLNAWEKHLKKKSKNKNINNNNINENTSLLNGAHNALKKGKDEINREIQDKQSERSSLLNEQQRLLLTLKSKFILFGALAKDNFATSESKRNIMKWATVITSTILIISAGALVGYYNATKELVFNNWVAGAYVFLPFASIIAYACVEEVARPIVKLCRDLYWSIPFINRDMLFNAIKMLMAASLIGFFLYISTGPLLILDRKFADGVYDVEEHCKTGEVEAVCEHAQEKADYLFNILKPFAYILTIAFNGSGLRGTFRTMWDHFYGYTRDTHTRNEIATERFIENLQVDETPEQLIEMHDLYHAKNNDSENPVSSEDTHDLEKSYNSYFFENEIGAKKETIDDRLKYDLGKQEPYSQECDASSMMAKIIEDYQLEKDKAAIQRSNPTWVGRFFSCCFMPINCCNRNTISANA